MVKTELPALPRNHPLAGVYAKILRAHKIMEEFETAKKEFIDDKPFEYYHDDLGDQTIVIRVKNVKPVPVEILTIIGDAIHNLRSSLDHLACQLVQKKHPSHNCEWVSFGISKSEEAFEQSLKKNNLNLAGVEVLEILRSIGPYKGGLGDRLWELHRLSIQDKHRLIIVASAGINNFYVKTEFRKSSITVSPFTDFEFGLGTEDEKFAILKEGDPVLGIDRDELFGGKEGQAKIDMKFYGDIAFDENGIVEGKAVLETLNDYSNDVLAIIDEFLPLFDS